MSDDKDMEDGLPEGEAPGMGAGDDAPDDISSENFADDGFAEDVFAEEVDVSDEADVGLEDYAGDDGDDFVEEDWEAYDDGEAYLDDSDTGNALEARRAAFNKFLIAIGVVIALVAGGMIMFNSEEENLGSPMVDQAKVAEAPVVAPEQKVEFHEETKVSAKDAFGIKYGDTSLIEEEEEVEVKPEGLLNNPEMISDIRDAEIERGEFYISDGEEDFYEDEAFDPGPELVEGTPPMPAPIAQVGEKFDDDFEDENTLTPMPESAGESSAAQTPRGPDGDMMSAGLPKARDIVRDSFGEEFGGEEFGEDGETVKVPDAGMDDMQDGERIGQAGLAEILGDESGGEDEPFYRLSSNEMQDEGDLGAEEDDLASMMAMMERNGSEEEPAGDISAPSPQTEAVMDKLDTVLSRIEDGFEQIEYLQEAVEGLEVRIAKLEKAPPQKVSAGNIRSSPPKSSAQAERKPAPVHITESAAARPSTTTTTTQWVLKSAQPGQAFVARKGESDLVRVSVGETLAGVGRVTSIDVQNGRWMVTGTKSTIMQ